LIGLIGSRKRKTINTITKSFFGEKFNQSSLNRYRKLYVIVPTAWTDLNAVLKKSGFQSEGLLLEPYKAGVDNIFFGKFLKV
jgi:hypothetical protein